MTREELIQELFRKLAFVENKQRVFEIEIDKLRKQIEFLQQTQEGSTNQEITDEVEKIISSPIQTVPKREPVRPKVAQQKASSKIHKEHSKSSIEKFVGENLISKIGVLIIILGVGVGAKYAIDNNLITPLTRIILGYLVGVTLLAAAMYLKKKYENLSAVVLSGALAVMYFITFAAYSFYEEPIISQTPAFVLMLSFTIFAVVAALHYDRQVIAHIGLVGAYAVPFLLSDGSGKVHILFTYMSILNSGILAIAIKKYWKALFINAFALSWLIVLAWFGTKYEAELQFSISLIFSTIFFLIFYTTFLAHKIINNEKFNFGDVLLMLINSFIYYGIGYATLDDKVETQNLVGFFTLGNAVAHFVVSFVLHQKQLTDRNLFYLTSGLVVVFITITFPVQLDGNWVTLLWFAEATLLFWLGRTKKIATYEGLAYPLMLLSVISLMHDWGAVLYQVEGYTKSTFIRPIFNRIFLTGVFAALCFVGIEWINRNENYVSALREKVGGLLDVLSFAISFSVIGLLYMPLAMEIAFYFIQLFGNSKLEIMTEYGYPTVYYNYDIQKFMRIWLINYTLAFAIALGFFAYKKIENQLFTVLYVIASAVVLFIFLSGGLYALSELRHSYISQSNSEYFQITTYNLWIRYVSYILVALHLSVLYKLIRQTHMKLNFSPFFDFVLHITSLWILSSELIHIMDLAGHSDSYKLGLSILWGVYSLFVLVLGIWNKKQYLRIGALAWFGITLVKLFIYDISHLPTISKTIVFICLGGLLVVMSFLYNKYKDLL